MDRDDQLGRLRSVTPRSRPDLAAAGERLLHRYGVGLAFLATIRLECANARSISSGRSRHRCLGRREFYWRFLPTGLSLENSYHICQRRDQPNRSECLN